MNKKLKYKIADIKLAEFGKKRLKLQKVKCQD